MKYEVKYTSQFKKDYKLALKQRKNTDELFKIIENLADGKILDTKYRDHALSGNFVGFRECHIEPDWLLIYKFYDDVLVLSLCRIGSHAALLKM